MALEMLSVRLRLQHMPVEMVVIADGFSALVILDSMVSCNESITITIATGK
jgi:hypothetical protein